MSLIRDFQKALRTNRPASWTGTVISVNDKTGVCLVSGPYGNESVINAVKAGQDDRVMVMVNTATRVIKGAAQGMSV